MHSDNSTTAQYLQQWHNGDRHGLDALLERHLPWLEKRVRQQMGPVLRRKGVTQDFVQETMVEFLKYSPRFLLSSEEHLRALLLRIMRNSMANQYEYFKAKRRAVSRENPLPPETVLTLDPCGRAERTPSQSVEAHEEEAWIRIGMEFLEDNDREVLMLRKWDNMPFADIGEALDITTDAARHRHNRALGRLGEKVHALRMGRLKTLLEEAASEANH